MLLRLSRSSPTGWLRQTLTTDRKFLVVFHTVTPSSVQMHVIFTISTFRTFYPLSVDFSSILCIIAFCGLLRRSLRGYIARFQQGGGLAGYPLVTSERPKISASHESRPAGLPLRSIKACSLNNLQLLTVQKISI